MPDQKTAIITGASRGIGAGLVWAFLKQGYNVVATSRNVSQQLTASTALVLIDDDIGKPETAAKVVEAAIKNFGSIDVLVSNAGIFFTKPFTEFSTADFNALVSTNLLGFFYITQLTVKQMLKQKSGSVASITAALADQPILGVNGSVPMITKGGLNSIIPSLAIEYAKQGIRFNAVAPGVVDTPMHKDNHQGLSNDIAANGKNRGRKRRCRRCSLPGPGRSSNRRGAPRGRRCARGPLVTPDNTKQNESIGDKDDKSENDRSSWINAGSHEGAVHRQDPNFGRSARGRLPQ